MVKNAITGEPVRAGRSVVRTPVAANRPIDQDRQPRLYPHSGNRVQPPKTKLHRPTISDWQRSPTNPDKIWRRHPGVSASPYLEVSVGLAGTSVSSNKQPKIDRCQAVCRNTDHRRNQRTGTTSRRSDLSDPACAPSLFTTPKILQQAPHAPVGANLGEWQALPAPLIPYYACKSARL